MINEENINKIKIYIQDNLAQKDSKYDRLVTESESSHMGGILRLDVNLVEILIEFYIQNLLEGYNIKLKFILMKK